MPGGDATPWSDAQAARQRRAAQEVVAELLDLQDALKQRGVEQWAPDPYAAATALAAEGDARYRDGQYEEATAHYQRGLAALQAIEQTIPAELERLLGVVRQAIEDGDAQAAGSALSVARLLSPDSPDLAALEARVGRLPELLPLLAQASAAEAAGDLAGAQALLQQATALDPEHKRAQRELERVSASARAQAFNEAMSEGYAALDKRRFDDARKAFRRAADLQKGSAEAASALQEVAAAETAGQLAALEQQGRALERREQWQQAVEVYGRAQQLDPSVLFAREGLARSRPRADLDGQLQQAIEEPRRLADATVAAAAEQLLARAGQVSAAGPRLKTQVAQLEDLLQKANTPVTITLRSDSETEVTVYKVARLGRFSERELSLRPGSYTAVGTRDGYRDVRRSFTIAHGREQEPVTIICTEPI
jgi:tetratricopeptide (TPR) repeat protein